MEEQRLDEPDARDNLATRGQVGSVTKNYGLKTKKKKDNTSLVSLALTFVVFIAFPYELFVLGLSLVNIFALTVFAAGLLTDIFTTKAGFNRGYDDYNPFYTATKNKVRNNTFLIGIGIFGAIRAYLIYYFWEDSLILIIVAMMSLIGPLWNSVMLSAPDDRGSSHPIIAPTQDKIGGI